MADTSVTPDPVNPSNYYAPPIHGNYTSDADHHIGCADALATMLIGEGFAEFRSLNDEIQQDLLWLLCEEIGRAKQALRAEQNRQAELRDQAARGDE